MTVKISTSIPCGNVTGVNIVEREGRIDVEFAPDPHGDPECMWFCFRATCQPSANGSLGLVLTNPDNVLGGGRPAEFRPVARYEGGDWDRLGEPDILDLQEYIEQTDEQEIRVVYENLTKGSRNHLRSFVSTLDKQTGESYQPQYLDQATYDAIAGTQTERGRGN